MASSSQFYSYIIFKLDYDEHEFREEDEENIPEMVNPDVNIRQYLDAHIMPTLIEALEKLTQDKPKDPI